MFGILWRNSDRTIEIRKWIVLRIRFGVFDPSLNFADAFEVTINFIAVRSTHSLFQSCDF